MTTETWLPDLARFPGVKYQAIVDALGEAIEQGALRGGERLPPQRDLAAKLGVDLTTVTRAYDTARQRGLIEARGRAGSFVSRAGQVEMDELSRLDAGMNMPPELPGGVLARAIAETTASLLLGGAPMRLQYQPAGGAARDRAVAAQLLEGRGLVCDEAQLLITAGGQNALHAIVNANFVAGDAIACGRFVYSGFKALAERAGLRLVPLAEMSALALREACEVEPIKGLYLVPTNDNPTAATLSAAERRAIAAVVEQHGLQLIEDDAYGALDIEALPPVASLVPARSWYIASTSKVLSPALRVAFVRAPSVGAALGLAADVHETTIMAPPLNAALVSAWIEDGSYERLLGGMRAEAAQRQALARAALAGLDYACHPQGYHLWLRLPEGVRAHDLADAMRPSGLSVIPAARFAVTDAADAQAVRVSLGGPIPHDRLARALRLLHGHATAPAFRRTSLI